MKDPKAVSSQISVKENNVDLMISRIFNASEIPPDLIETVRQYQQRLINKGVSQSVDLKTAIVNECKIYIGNISTPLDLNSVSEQELLKELQLQSSSSVAETGETTQTQPGKLNCQFVGINQFQSITIRIQDKTWQVEFSRLQRPVHSGLGNISYQKELKTKAHRDIYNSLCAALKPLSKKEIEKKVMGNMVVLQGGSGLGKTNCAQHYFYHQAAKKHQMVAWLSGKSQESFLQGWRELAQQLRNIQTSQSESSDDEVIKEWCENQLGQWLLIIDEVNIDAAWLNARLPKRGGHVLITTHQPNYGIELGQVKPEPLNLIPITQIEQSSNSVQQTQTDPISNLQLSAQSSLQLKPQPQSQPKLINISFTPLSKEDSKELLQAYVGNYWQATGYPQEQKAIEYLIEALGGYPSALTQMALLVHKKCISFERLVEQFKQPILRSYLLSDTVFDQLKEQTFMLRVKKGKEQLLEYFNKRYPQLIAEQHEQHLKQFIEILQQEMTQQTTQQTTKHIIEQEKEVKEAKQVKEIKEVKEGNKNEEDEEIEKIEYKEIKVKKEEENKQKKEEVVECEIVVNKQIDNHTIQSYWQAVEASCQNINFNIEELISWLHCLPIFYDKANNQWQISQAGLSALSIQTNRNSMPNAKHLQIVPIEKETVETKLAEVANTPKLPQEIDISVRLENASLKNAEIDILTIGKPSEFKVWQLPTVNPYFIPRPKLTDELKAKLPQKKAGEESAKLLLTAATGMGGIGKTELARHFITSKELSDHYQRRFWLTATTESQIRNEFMQLAVYLGLVESKKYIEDKELIHLIHRWLSINPGWLMILDNADDYNSITSWIPKEGGAVLVTTRERNPGTMKSEQIVKVELLEPEEAITWLYQLSERNKDSLSEQERLATKQLVDDLGYLPLAIAQSAAYLRVQRQISIAEYQTRFITLLSDTTLASQEASENIKNNPDIKCRKVVSSTWTLSLQAIEAYAISHNIPNIGKELFSTCAYCAPKNIPVLLLESCLKQFYKNESSLISCEVDEYVGELIRYSLLERNGINNLVSIHSLVQQVIIDQLIKEKKDSDYLLKGVQALNKLYPYGPDHKQMVDIALKRLLKAHLVKILSYLDDYLRKLNSLNDENTKNLLLDLQKNILLKLLIYLADTYDTLGDVKEQKILFERILQIQETYFGKEDGEVAKTLVNLANTYGDLGNTQKKKQLLEQALKIFEKKYDNEHVEVAGVLVNLANAYGDLGDAQKEKLLLEQALKIFELKYGKENILVAGILNDLAVAHGDLGNVQEKKKLLERALRIKETHYGKDHVDVASTFVNLANAYGDLGNAKEQKTLLERALRINETHYGKEHIEIAYILVNLANAYGDLGDAQKKKLLLEQALKIEESHYGESHVNIANTLNNLATAYGELGNVQEKKKLLERALPIQEMYYGKSHVIVARTLGNLGVAYCNLGDAQQGKKLLVRVLIIHELCYGKEHEEVARTLVNLANVYGVLGDANEQKKLLERALPIIEAHYGKEHVMIARTLGNLAVAYGELGNVQEKKKLLERALKIKETHYGKDHVEIVSTLGNLANAYGDLGDNKEKRILLERALKIIEAYYGEEHSEAAMIFFNLSVCYLQQENLTEAKYYMQKAYNIFMQSANCGANHPLTKKAYQSLAVINKKLSVLQKEENISGGLFKGIFNKSAANVSNNNLLGKIFTRYNLPDDSQLSLEESLRIAATNNQVEDINIFFKTGKY